MKALFKVLFLGVLTSGLLLACAKKGGSSGVVDPNAYNPYGYQNPYGYNQFPYAFSGQAQIVNPQLYNNYLNGQFCAKGKAFFGLVKYNTCGIVNNPPVLELQMVDMTMSQAITLGKLVVRIRQDNGWQINNQAFPKEEIRISLRKINNNTQFEATAIDAVSGNGFGARMAIRGSGLPAAATLAPSIPVEIQYSGQTMLRATLTRIR